MLGLIADQDPISNIHTGSVMFELGHPAVVPCARSKKSSVTHCTHQYQNQVNVYNCRSPSEFASLP